MAKASEIGSARRNYPEHNHEELGEYYTRHVDAMTREDLYYKSDIAAQLAWRDREIDLLRAESESLRKDLTHWKANHDNQVERARLLLERPDLPLERIQTYQQYEALRKDAERYRWLRDRMTFSDLANECGSAAFLDRAAVAEPETDREIDDAIDRALAADAAKEPGLQYNA